MKKQKTDFKKRLGRRKLRLYLIFTAAFIISLISAYFTLADYFDRVTQPQIARAIIQISKMFPEIEYNDVNLRKTYDETIAWQKWYYTIMGMPVDKQSEFKLDENEYSLPDESLSWIERISRIKVGNDGYVVIVSKDDGKILSHPDSNYIGQRMMMLESNKVVPMNEAKHPSSYDMLSINSDMDPNSLKAEYSYMAPENVSGIQALVHGVTVGYSVSYNNTYIIFGVSFKEMFSFMVKGFIVTLIAFIAVWVFIRYVSMLISRHDRTERMLRSKFIAQITLLSIGILITSWYVYVLSGTTLSLSTMEQHAQTAVETLDDYKKTRDNINQWADDRYLTQCKFIADLIMSDKYRPSDYDRATLQDLSKIFEVKYIFIYDKNGNVVATNSPYDNISLSQDPESQSFIFRKLLSGVDHIIQEPVVDELSGEQLQFIGVSLRDKNDLSDGFVQIAVDPTLRYHLTEWLTVDTVLENLLVGLPDYAVAVDKETMLISNTTGLGFVGESAETIGLTAEKLAECTSGILTLQDKEYHAGFGESSDLYIIPIATQNGSLYDFGESSKMAVIPIITLILIAIAALWHYQKNVYEAAPEEDDEAKKTKSDPTKDVKNEEGLFSGFSDFVKVKEKYGMDDRWKANIPKHLQTPEMRIKRIITILLSLFCLTILLPIMYYTFAGVQFNNDFNSIAYVIKGGWDKGFNIFAVTSCIFLLCGLYIFVVAAYRVLYSIARVSGTRTETVCLLLKNSLKYICSIIFIYYGLSQFGIPTQTLLASAGLLSLLLTFGAKDLVSDIIAGFFIIFEGTIQVGDWISVGTWSGLVMEIGVRTTKIRYYADTKIVNNSQIRDFINSDGDVARMSVKFLIPYSIKLEEFEMILKKELPEMAKNIPWLVKPPKYQFVQAFEENGLLLRVSLYTIPYKRTMAQRTFLRELKLLYERYNIEIPFNRIIALNGNYDPPVMITDKTADEPENTSGESEKMLEKADNDSSESSKE